MRLQRYITLVQIDVLLYTPGMINKCREKIWKLRLNACLHFQNLFSLCSSSLKFQSIRLLLALNNIFLYFQAH